MSDGLFSAVELGASRRAGYRLQYAEVFNWGTFDQEVWRFTPGTDTALLTGQSAPALTAALLKQVHAFANGAPQSDDIAIMTLKIATFSGKGDAL